MEIQEEILPSNEVDLNETPSIIYVDPLNASGLALNLLTFGISIFSNAKRIKEYDAFASLNVGKSELVDIDKATPFLIEHMVNMFRIITCFENYCKAILLLNGYVVHIIKHNHKDKVLNEQYKQLSNKQKKMPVSVKEVRHVEQFIIRPAEKVKALLPGITNKTISFDTMLTSSRYQKVIQLPIGILQTLHDYNRYRNTHHLYVQEHFHISDKIVNDVALLKDFITGQQMKGLYDKLDSSRIRWGT